MTSLRARKRSAATRSSPAHPRYRRNREYSWWFDELPAEIDTGGCRRVGGHVLLYTGISPRRPPMNGRAPSKSHLRRRLQTHYAGNAEGSTLRKSLGCLLADRLGLTLRRVGSGTRRTLVAGERELSRWMGQHAFVSWVLRDCPWALEAALIGTVDLPLSLESNSRNAFHAELSRVRAGCVAQANALPVVTNPGVGGR